jgi:hypothetical protein
MCIFNKKNIDLLSDDLAGTKKKAVDVVRYHGIQVACLIHLGQLSLGLAGSLVYTGSKKTKGGSCWLPPPRELTTWFTKPKHSTNCRTRFVIQWGVPFTSLPLLNFGRPSPSYTATTSTVILRNRARR